MCVLDRSDMAREAIEADAADGECAEHLQCGDCEDEGVHDGEGEHEGGGEGDESDDVDPDVDDMDE